MIRQSEKKTSASPLSRGSRPIVGPIAAGLFCLATLIPATLATAASPADDYIVLLRASADAPDVARDERRRGNEVGDVFDSRVNGLVAKLGPADVKRLRQDPDVAVVERDRPVWALGVRDSATTLWGLDRIDQRTRPGNGRITTATDGSGVAAYVIDTGIRPDHVQFESRVAARGFSAFPDQYGWSDCQGHGTHVAGTVAGKDYGVAPKAELVAIRVLGCDGSGSTSGVIAGVDWAAADHPAGAPAVANLSLGGGYSSSMNLAIQRLFNDGVSVAVAAGNSNADACGASPASAPDAITVGATTSTDARASFSNFGSCLDLFAPGAGILSATHSSTTSTASWSGTSMASPHVAGAAALLLSGEPNLTPAQVTNRISSDSTTGVVSSAGTGSLNRLLYVGSPSSNPVPEPPPEPEPPPPAPPANDPFSSVATVSLSGTTGTTVAATREAGEPDHGWGASRSIWYRWTAPSNGSLTLSTQGSGYDTVLAAYSGSALGSLSKLASNDDNGSGGLWSRISFSVNAGTTYRIAVDGYNGATGSVSLSGTFTSTSTPPPDTTPPNPPVLTASPDPISYTDSATFSFNGESGGSFQCSLDSSAWTNCSSPRKVSGLAKGPHTFQVRQKDSAGNISPATAFSWEIKAPVEARTPTVTGPDIDGRLLFGGAGAGEKYVCRIGTLVDGALTACDSPYLVPTQLTDGTYRFRLAIEDSSGNRSIEATGSFTVTLTPEPPSGNVGVTINDGAAFTRDPNVTLDVVWPRGTRKVEVANDGSFNGEEFPVAGQIPWTLQAFGQERIPKIVYLRFLGAGDTPLGTATDDIVLDTTPPRLEPAELIGRSRGKYRVRLAVRDPVSGVHRVQFENAGQRPRTGRSASNTRSYSGRTMLVGSNTRPRWYRASDRAGNWSDWAPVRRAAR